MIVPDLLGHGNSDMPHDAGAYREPDVALDVLAVLDAEGVEEAADLWDYSRGSRLADLPYQFDLSSVAAPCLVYVGEQDVFAPIVPEDVRQLGAAHRVLQGLNHSQAYLRRDLVEPLARAYFASSA